MPQARRGESTSTGSGRSTGTKRASAAKPAAKAAKPAAKTTAKRAAAKPSSAKPAAGRSTGARKSSTRSAPRAATATAAAAVGVDPARVEAVANRLRKLNEKIIEAGREAGESTLTSYEKALKAIANGIQSGPGRSEIDWISHLATTQAKFLRDLTDSWTTAARDLLK